MMPKFLVDECTRIAVVRFLRGQGYDTFSVVESMPQASDSDILNHAMQEQRVIVTNDKDFGDMVYRDRREHAGIVLLRLAAQRQKSGFWQRYSRSMSANLQITS